MAGHSAESLLAWMQDTTRLRGWDAVIAIDGKAVNGLLTQAYQLGVDQGLAQPVPDGSIAIPDTNISHFFSGLVLGPPALSFEHSSLESAPVAWRMSALSGTHTVVENSQGHNSILKMFAYTPSGVADLRLDTEMTSQGPALAVDLSVSENVTLDFSGSSLTEQREAGKFLQAWFRDPQNRQQKFTLGVFGEQSNPLLNVRRIDARTQRESAEDAGRGAGDADGRGALLLFTTLEHGATGGFPDDAADFRYLIPNDVGKDYSATAVFSSHALHRAAFGHAVMQALQSPDFEFIVPEEKPLERMVAKAGLFDVASERYQTANFEFESTPLSIPAVSAQRSLTIDFDYSQAAQSWSFPVNIDFRYRALNSAEWKSRSETFNVNLKYAFHLVPGESDDQVMEGHLYVPYDHSEEVSAVEGRLDDLTDPEQRQIKGFVAHTVKHSLTKALGRTLHTQGYDSVLSGFDLGENQVVQALKQGMPHDLAIFGQVDSAAAAFTIVEQQALVPAGGKLQMTTRPARAGLVWSVENPPGINTSPGTVDKQGIYTAPDAQALSQAFQHVLVTATDPATQQRSTVLVTVQADALSINPLIQVCNYGERVSLSATTLGGGNLAWSIVDPVSGESGSLEPEADGAGGQVYVAGPKVSGKTSVLEEIAVSDGQHTRSTWILVRQMQSALTIEAVQDSGLSDGEIRLQARSNGNGNIVSEVEWSKPASMAGSFSGDVYKSDPKTLDRFVLIFARLNDPEWGVFEGHIILPLPLNRSAEVLKKLLPPPIEDNTLDRLLGLSHTAEPTQGWGAILAVSGEELNKQLEQQYVERYQHFAFLPLFNGVVAIDALNVESLHVQQVELGVPSLSFLAADASSVTVTMNIVAGRYSRSRQPTGGAASVSGSFKIAESMGFHVTMNVPLQVDSEGHVTLNLAKGEDFDCNLAGVDAVANQKLSGFFAAEFQQIALHRAVFVLLGIDLNHYDAQSPAGVRVLTLPAPGARDVGARHFGEGALVLLIRMRSSHGDGQFPLNSEFPYPFPARLKARSGKSYGASLVLSKDMQYGTEKDRPPVLDSLRSGAGTRLAASDIYAADDLLVFANLETAQASVTPLFSTLLAGQTKRFALCDEQGQEIAAYNWKVFSLQGHSVAVNGTMTSSGVYTAADVTQMGHDALRIVITATYADADDGKARTVSALLNVVSELMEIAPRVMVVAGGDEVQPVLLKASTLGGAPLSWALQGEEAGRLTEHDGGVLFTPDARSGRRALATQQISVQGDEKRQATVLIANGQQALRIEPAVVPRALKGVPVQLHDDSALLLGYERRWKVKGGAGNVDAQGLFTPPADYIGSSVVSCEIVNNNVVLASGYSVIEVSEVVDELPWTELSMFTVTVPGGMDNQSAGSLYPNGYQQLRLQIKTQVMPVDGVEYSLSGTEQASMRLTDSDTGQVIDFVEPPNDGIPEDSIQHWCLNSTTNRFKLALPDDVAAELPKSSVVATNHYLHSKAPEGYLGTFHATFQQDGNRWWTSEELEDVNSKVRITPRRIPRFDTSNYLFVPTRAEGSGGNPTATPPGEGEPDDVFNLNLHTTDYWSLKIRYPNTNEIFDFVVLKFLPSSRERVSTSMILWESEQQAETFFSWTGYIFNDPDASNDVDKILFDASLEHVIKGVESLDIPVNMEVFESGGLTISLHRTPSVPYVSPDDGERDTLYRSLAVSLLDELGNVHRRRISFLSEGEVGRRNRLMHTLYIPL
ncbi:hypothetical protein GIV19_14340 [Pseudomonas syringae]|uniref:hypothetical protein n=1 Tax=Pseudomonas syringae TaxID=317 RepID=UPI001F16CB74|nr:hypothetical protein [Pseudomonas syringae]MCF5708464.1 hypothetical protein [Pseudomonas syringae]